MTNQPQDPKDAAGRDAGVQKTHDDKDDKSIHQGDQEDMARRQGEHPAHVVAPSDPDVIRGTSPEKDRDARPQEQTSSGTDEEE